ncbi:hypothetical protein VTG60DRAFT_2034 [Thermothelomyces hinnuleus]
MKNRQKSRSGCRTCKLRRLRCDETKPGCRNCAQKGFECPGYQQRLQWSTKHERPTTTQTSGPPNFTQLVTAASESIVSTPATTAQRSGHGGARASPVVPVFDEHTRPTTFLSPSTSASPSASGSPLMIYSSPSSSTASPPAHHEESTVSAEVHAGLAPVVNSVASNNNNTMNPTPKTEPGTADEAEQASGLTMFEPLVDIPTFLIEHWFKSVCPSWSALDSPANPYRRLTANLWHRSTPVFYTLQAISAASLVERLPHVMRDTAQAAPRKADEAIQEELCAFSTATRPKFPTELLLSLFCMSSSTCWLEASQLGQQYVRQARAVLKILEEWTLDSESQELLAFFKGCLIYEEMLRSVVSDGEDDIQHMLGWPEPATRLPLVPAIPHTWTGVSSEILRPFGKALALCRRSRNRWRLSGATTYRVLKGAMKDIEEAKKVEDNLFLAGVLQTGECYQPQEPPDRTRDLYHLTEAYRLCGLVQLYEAFPDLAVQRTPALKDADGPNTIWQTWVSPLALHVITDVLTNVPPGSMSRIQPIICLCAGSGLRYDAKVPLGSGNQRYFLSTEPGSLAAPLPKDTAPDIRLLHPNVSENGIKTSQARRLVMDRLDQLEVTLPPRPIAVAKKLLRAVWSAYDEEIELSRWTHWLDVMATTGLHSLFG